MHFKDQPVRFGRCSTNPDSKIQILHAASSPLSQTQTFQVPVQVQVFDPSELENVAQLFIFSKLLNMNQLRMDMAEQVIINHVHLILDPEHHHHQVLNHHQAL